MPAPTSRCTWPSSRTRRSRRWAAAAAARDILPADAAAALARRRSGSHAAPMAELRERTTAESTLEAPHAGGPGAPGVPAGPFQYAFLLQFAAGANQVTGQVSAPTR